MKVSAKYQVVIPPHVRRSTGIRPGDEVAWVEDEFGLHLVRIPTFTELRGFLRPGVVSVPFERDKEFE